MTPVSAAHRILQRLCEAGGCDDRCPPLRMRYEESQRRLIFQHGDNPEAICPVTDLEIVASPPGVTLVLKVGDWLRRVHEYERKTA